MVANEAKKHRRLQSQMQSPTVPIYDPTFPDDATNGQIALKAGRPYYYWDGGADPAPAYSVAYWHPFSVRPDWLILQGETTSLGALPSGDNDHAKYDPANVLTETPDEWTFTLDGSSRIREVDVAGPGLYMAYANVNWAAPTGDYTKAATMNIETNHSETWNGITGFSGMANTVTDYDAAAVDQFVGAMAPIDSSGGRIFVTVEHTNGVDVSFLSGFLYITKFV